MAKDQQPFNLSETSELVIRSILINSNFATSLECANTIEKATNRVYKVATIREFTNRLGAQGLLTIHQEPCTHGRLGWRYRYTVTEFGLKCLALNIANRGALPVPQGFYRGAINVISP